MAKSCVVFFKNNFVKLLQINVTANWGSTGKIAEDIGKFVIEEGWESWIAYGRGNPSSKSNIIRIGNDWDMKMHGLETRLFDNHGLASRKVTQKFIEQIKELHPDIIHLHNIHGYYVNYSLLFDFLKEYDVPVVWTLHDCWPFTGHCAYYDFVKCDRWVTECHDCPQLHGYPASLFMDRSRANFLKKKESFLGLNRLTLVPVSDWLRKELQKSFLSCYPSITIHNGIDLSIFTPSENIIKENDQKMILGVASIWEKRKGLEEFVELRKRLPSNYDIILVGLSKTQISNLPTGIKGIERTENISELVELYSRANVFVNPTLEDNFPTTNIEALACGTPVITYNTGGSPEAIDEKTGFIVVKRDIDELTKKVRFVCEKKPFSLQQCRNRSEKYYDNRKTYQKYINLYNHLVENTNQ